VARTERGIHFGSRGTTRWYNDLSTGANKA